jgi:hypothetical protein
VADLVVVVGVVVVVVVVVVVLVVALVEGDVVVVATLLEVEDEEPVREVADVALLAPGCSLATRRPMRAEDAVAASAMDCVSRRRRRRAR